MVDIPDNFVPDNVHFPAKFPPRVVIRTRVRHALRFRERGIFFQNVADAPHARFAVVMVTYFTEDPFHQVVLPHTQPLCFPTVTCNRVLFFF